LQETNTGLLVTGAHHSPKGRFNSSFLLTPTPQGITLQEHKKTVLTAPEGSPPWWPADPNQTFQKGPPSQPLTYQNHSLGILLCAEEVAPLSARALRRQGANILLGINSHSPIGSWGTYQSLRCSRLRAIETQTPIVRCTNQGTSSLISPTGKILWESSSQDPKWLRISPSKPPSPLGNPAAYWGPWAILGLSIIFLIPQKSPTQKRNS
jgi:apolipoprotein N-acyltransferase